MSSIILSLVILGTAISVGIVECCNPHGHSNGCSTPIPYFFQNKFRPECDRHDICYGCGAAYGISRSDCDRRFHINLLNRCRYGRTIRLRSFCTLVTDKYYLGVSIFGGSHYRRRPGYWCRQAWVRQCL